MKSAILKLKIVLFFLMITMQSNAQTTAFFNGFESQATSPWNSYLGFYDWYYQSQFTAGNCPPAEGNFYLEYNPAYAATALPSGDDIYATINLPGDIYEARVKFNWAITTLEANLSPVEYDSIVVIIRHATLGYKIAKLAKFSNLNAHAGTGCFSWNSSNISLPSSLINPGLGSSGSTFRVSFEAYNDSIDITSFFLDSVAVIYQPCNIPITLVSATICDNQSFTTAGGQMVNTVGVYYDTLQAVTGCDSVIETTLNINPTFLTPVSATICDNQSFTTAGGQMVNTAGVYYDTLQAVTGCDSVIETTLNINPTFLTPVSATICDNQSFTTAGGQMVNTPGVYYDTLQAVTGCDSVIETTLNVNSLPVSISLGTDTIICNNIPEITLDGGDFVKHTWFKDNNLLTDTTRFLTVTGQLGAGSYHVLYEDLNGCSASSDTLEITYNEICPSVEKLFSAKNLINFYPNPTIGILTFNSDKEISKIKLTDISGKVFYDYQINTVTNSLDISQFNNGIYFINVLFSDGQMQTKKIILLK